MEGTITLHIPWTLAHEDPGHKNTANKYCEFIFKEEYITCCQEILEGIEKGIL